ncbi:MAG: 1-acyl-sn-glycerol-3-phosphate acyltransferase [Paracoccus sp.]|nr:1-acyl-sn-glycerol-3-phosphate acyltransferase [Paracoccus sp. (in: a-proteobacteria)]|tara:strand:+ start:42085 stop:42780 length:696 start_codon:yes stop_codon:yes gene_type:complete
MAWLRTILFGGVFYSGSLLFVLGAMVAGVFSHGALLRAAAGWSRFHRWCVTNLLGIRIRIEGERPAGQVFYVMRHESFFEAIDLPTFLAPFPVVFAKIELIRIPLWGALAARYGVVPVDRSRGASALRGMKRAADTLKPSGRDFALFPEGTRVDVGSSPEMQSGLYGIYRLLGLPMVPVAVDSGRLYHRMPKQRGTITYRIGDVIPPGLERLEVQTRVRDAINALNVNYRG